MILKGVMAVTLRYFTEFGKPAPLPCARKKVHVRYLICWWAFL